MKSWLLTLTIGVLAFGTGEFAVAEKSNAGAKPANISEIISDTGSHLGKRVTVRGTVEDVHGTKVVVLSDDKIVESKLLAVSKKDLRSLDKGIRGVLREDDKIQISGTLRQLNVLEVERELGPDLSREIEIETEASRPVLFVESLQLLSKARRPASK